MLVPVPFHVVVNAVDVIRLPTRQLDGRL